MNCDLTKNRFVDEDFVFIIFNLLHRTSLKNEAVFNFKELRKNNYKNIDRLKNKEVFEVVAKIKKNYEVNFQEFKFDYREFFTSASARSRESMEFAMEGNHEDEEFIVLEKITKNDFDFADLERLSILMSDNEFDFDDILGGINFIGTLSRKNKNALKHNLDRYISHFINEELLPDKKVVKTYAAHKELMLPVLYATAKEYGRNTAIGSSRKDLHYRFIEPLIKLEMEGYVKIYELKTQRDNLGYIQYRADIKIEDKLTKQSKHAKSERLHKGLIDIAKETKWEDLHITLYENQIIKIKIEDEIFNSNCKEFDFIDSRKDKPEFKKCWNLFLLLAKEKGVLSLSKLTKKKKEELQIMKSEITKILKNAFPLIQGDPFDRWDKKTNEYKIKIRLTPTEAFREDFRDRKIKDEAEKFNPYADIEDVHKEQTRPLI